MLAPATIAEKLGAPSQNVVSNWPLIVAALDELGIHSDLVEIAAAATIGTEVPHFEPIAELGGPAYLSRYDGRSDLGNSQPGDGERFKGRGFVQLTGRINYAAAGRALGLNLEAAPDKAMEPATAARVLAWFFATRHVADAANAKAWETVRRRVNGGLNGWPRFSALVEALHG
jgi:putative chitinase